MPNHCCNTLVVSATALPGIISKYIGKDKRGDLIFDFERVIPVGDIPDWHEQRLEKWGTKWIGYEVSVGEDRIDFFTAWTPPLPVLKKLAELHKDLVFRLEYYEPGMGFRGEATAKWQNRAVLLDDNRRDTTGEETKEAPPDDYEKLFEMWADFDDAEASDEAARLIEAHDLGPVDAVSFTAFSYGYERALRKAKEKQ